MTSFVCQILIKKLFSVVTRQIISVKRQIFIHRSQILNFDYQMSNFDSLTLNSKFEHPFFCYIINNYCLFFVNMY